MRRIGRWMLNGVTVLSLMLCVATVGVSYHHPLLFGFSFHHQLCMASLSRGRGTIDNSTQVSMERKRDIRVCSVLRTQIEKAWADNKRADAEGDPEKAAHFNAEALFYNNQVAAVLAAQTKPWSHSGPLWILAAVSGAVLVVAGWRWARRQELIAGCCRTCQYDLTGNASGVCPECGMKIAEGK